MVAATLSYFLQARPKVVIAAYKSRCKAGDQTAILLASKACEIKNLKPPQWLLQAAHKAFHKGEEKIGGKRSPRTLLKQHSDDIETLALSTLISVLRRAHRLIFPRGTRTVDLIAEYKANIGLKSISGEAVEKQLVRGRSLLKQIGFKEDDATMLVCIDVERLGTFLLTKTNI